MHRQVQIRKIIFYFIKRVKKKGENEWLKVLDYEVQLNHLDHLTQLENSKTESDVQFLVQGEAIPSHTLILQRGRLVFAAMFEHDMTESSSRIVVVNDIEPKVIRQLLRFLYTGDAPEVEDDEIMVEQLFIAADKYQVDTLKDWCDSLLSKQINEENAVRLLVLAHLHYALWLQEDCIDFIVNKKTEFIEREDFQVLNHNYPLLFIEVTKLMSN